MTRGGTNEFSRLGREKGRHGLRVLFLRRLTGEDQGPSIDIIGSQLSALIGILDKPIELLCIDGRFVDVWRQQHGGFRQNFAIDHNEATGKNNPLTTQGQTGKNQMRSGGTDIDTHGGQRDPL